MGLTFHSQLHGHLAGTTAIASFTGILALVLLSNSVDNKAESPPHSTVQQEAATIGDGLPISVPCHLGLWVAPDLQEKETHSLHAGEFRVHTFYALHTGLHKKTKEKKKKRKALSSLSTVAHTCDCSRWEGDKKLRGSR